MEDIGVFDKILMEGFEKFKEMPDKTWLSFNKKPVNDHLGFDSNAWLAIMSIPLIDEKIGIITNFMEDHDKTKEPWYFIFKNFLNYFTATFDFLESLSKLKKKDLIRNDFDNHTNYNFVYANAFSSWVEALCVSVARVDQVTTSSNFAQIEHKKINYLKKIKKNRNFKFHPSK